ncbi:hypothetical protein [Archaeoglobus veneficus]|uniref:Uncharacterized protein n=1 Tax=Archaeoglobus veneficus (strain DSM 11195 / SNP6) TaxID=693661 RepID=F2KRI5_ARCVS|nr:hypothetical protein [Archaeoglobus veneficus]AEA46750.1 hypothetical protein Arcve_0732 [Archaeoglobus veneficus SNP6]
MVDIHSIFKRIERGEKISRKELEELGIKERMSHKEWLERVRVEGMDVHTYVKLNPPESDVFVVPKELLQPLKSTGREEQERKQKEKKKQLKEAVGKPRADKLRKPKKEIPIEKVRRLRERGYSYRQIALILRVEDGIYVSPMTVWRRLRECLM